MNGFLHDFHGMSFGGIPAAQHHSDLFVWEKVLNNYPDLKQIVEIGTWHGGMSWFLWVQTQARGMSFVTCDVVEPLVAIPCFQQINVFSPAGRRELMELIGDEPMLLFCDGGNKPRELKDFTGNLPEGSLVAVHDWGTETLVSDVPDWLEETMNVLCDSLGSVTRFFVVNP